MCYQIGALKHFQPLTSSIHLAFCLEEIIPRLYFLLT